MASHQAEQRVEIAAPARVAFEALTDYERLAEWQSAIEELEVEERYPDGTGKVVAYAVDLKVRKIRYTLRYEYEAPRSISFELVEGDVADIHGSYEFEPVNGGCAVRAAITVDPGVSVPGPIKRMLAGQMLKRTLAELGRRSESLAEAAAR